MTITARHAGKKRNNTSIVAAIILPLQPLQRLDLGPSQPPRMFSILRKKIWNFFHRLISPDARRLLPGDSATIVACYFIFYHCCGSNNKTHLLCWQGKIVIDVVESLSIFLSHHTKNYFLQYLEKFILRENFKKHYLSASSFYWSQRLVFHGPLRPKSTTWLWYHTVTSPTLTRQRGRGIIYQPRLSKPPWT